MLIFLSSIKYYIWASTRFLGNADASTLDADKRRCQQSLMPFAGRILNNNITDFFKKIDIAIFIKVRY